MTDIVQSVKRREAKYEKLCATIERTQRKWEKADKAATRALKSLAQLERKRIRSRKALDRLRAEAANAIVESVVPAEPPPPAMDDPNHPDLVAARELLGDVNKSVRAIPHSEAHPHSKVGPKRKAKPLRDAPAEAKEMLDKAIGESMADRAKRMESMGFRPMKRKNKPEATA